MNEKKSKKTVYEKIRKRIYSQDFQQKMNMCISVTLEIYRVMISSLLIVFVPQSCEAHVCTLMENLHADNTRYSIGLIINYITMASFIMLYICEIRREEKLIKLLEVNNTISTDNESVGKRLDVLDENKKQKLFDIDRDYQYVSYFVMCVYALNTIFSGIVINEYSLGNQTMVIFLTNILFMITKLSNVYIIVNTDKNIFLSAYLNTKVQFNDIDPHEILKIDRRRSVEHNIEEIKNTRGFCLIEKTRIKLLDAGGFEIENSSSDSDSDSE